MPGIAKARDTLVFDMQSFSVTLTGVLEQVLSGSGHASSGGLKFLVADDLTAVSLPAGYTSAQYSIPGQGLLSVEVIDLSSFSDLLFDDGRPAIRDDATGTAKFTRLMQAQQPGSPPVPDATSSYSGTWFLRSAGPTAEIAR